MTSTPPLQLAAPLLGPNTVLLTMQDGVEAPDRVAGIFCHERVVCGISWVTAGYAEAVAFDPNQCVLERVR